MSSSHRYTEAKKITLIGALSNTLQGIIKIIGGLWYNSHGLIADGLHSLSDLLTDLMVIFASRYGSQDADEAHPYGHQRIETAATLLLSLLLILAGIGIGWHAFDEWYYRELARPDYQALVIALASIVLNEALFFATLRVGKKIQSPLVKANAWHHRSDSASALVVSLGIVGGMLGYAYLDAFAAMIVASLIIKMGIDYSWNSVKELVDTAAPLDTVKAIEQLISAVPGVNKIHQLRTRIMGHHILVDVHILVFPYLSVSEGHYIAQHVHHKISKAFPEIKDVTVHVDPEDDEQVSPSLHLPNRKTLEDAWIKSLKQQFPDIQTWNLHYLDGKITIDLYLNANIQDFDKLSKACQVLLATDLAIKTFRFFMRLDDDSVRSP